MSPRILLLTFAGLTVAGLGAYGQIGLPGQYPSGQPSGQPGGQYPGQYPPGRRGPYPNDPNDPRNGQQVPSRGTTRDNGRNNRPVSTTVTGILRRFAANQLVIESDDHRVIWFRLSDKLAVDKDGKSAELSSFAPGDYLSVDYSENDEGVFTATAVDWRKAATPADAARARENYDLPKLPNSPLASVRGDSSANRRDISRDPGDDRPILRRKNPEPAPSAPQASAPPPEVATAKTPEAPAPAAAPPAPPQEEVDTRPTTTIKPPDGKDDDDDGPPTLRRGAPPARRALVIAPPRAPAPSAGESRPVDPVATASPRPAPIPLEDDPILVKAREAAGQYVQTLPNFFAQQITTRYQTDNPKRGWDVHDVVTADVAYEDGRESYKNIKVGNKAVNTAMEDIEGSRSTGEFSTMMQDLMDPYNGVMFRKNGTDTIHNRSTYVYKFEIAREVSHWRIESPSQLYYPAYRGNIWIDKENYRVLRIEQQARNMPVMFPFDTTEASSDYDYVRLGTPQQFLLPVEAEVLTCQRGTSVCMRNRIEFRNYRKFGAESNIIFTDKP